MKSVDLVIPVYNEEHQLKATVDSLTGFLRTEALSEYRVKLVIVNNGSTDGTASLAMALAKRYQQVSFMNLREKGRGRALLAAWQESKADIVSYTDADLSADLAYFPLLLEAIARDGADIAIGSRLKQGARVRGRTLMREMMSRTYNLLLRWLFQTSFTDAQCGFKAMDRKKFELLRPHIRNRNWFFDTELLVIAQKTGMKIAEVPLSWRDDPSSTVKISKTAVEDLFGMLRLIWTQPWQKVSIT